MWSKLVTLAGTYPLEQCEFAFRFGDAFCRHFSEKEAPDYGFEGNHPCSFRTPAKLLGYMHTREPSSVEFGRVFLGKDRGVESSDAYLITRAPLVFDFDMDDHYHPLRTCGCDTKYKVCDVCWRQFMAPAMKEMLYILKEKFQFKHIFTVFSGRRGFHMWVIDREVWGYSFAQRMAIGKTFTSVKLDEEVLKLEHLIKLPLLRHPGTGKWALLIDETFVPSAYADPDLQKDTSCIEEIIKNAKNA